MLTDKQIADALDLIDSRYQSVVTKYLQKVGKTINEIGHLNQSSINLLIQLRRMGVDTQTIERELQKVTKLTKQDIRTLYRKAAQEANTDARFSYVSKGVEPDNIRWEALVENIWQQTAGAMDNLSKTTVITGGYRDVIDDAVQAVTMGAADYNSAIRDTVRRIGREGLQVEYESTYITADGQMKHRHRRLDSAVRQNILDGIRQVQQKAQELIGEEIGADGVDITAHPNSAPDHEPVQGRRFDLDNFQRMQSGLDFEDVDSRSYKGFERPITQWRCRHLIFYILLGVTRRMYTDDQLDSWQQENQKGCTIDGKHYTNYEATQLLRNLETEIRRQKDTATLAKASGDDMLRRECQSNINKLAKKYNAVAEAAGLKKQIQKTRVEGFAPINDEDQKLFTAEENRGTIRAVSGARITDTDSRAAKTHAERYYGLVRSMSTDVAKIAKNTGYSESVIQRIKNFIFVEEHDLGGPVPERFAPSFSMAQSWQRLISGNPKPHDLTLLRHELMEKELMDAGMSQDDAHIETSKVYNYAKESDEYYAALKEHKNRK